MMELDARRDLETIRSLMERAREYRHPPAPAAFVAGGCGVAAGLLTDRYYENLESLGLLWGGAFVVAFAFMVFFTARAARREGIPFWSPLAREVTFALWPSLVAAIALTVALARAGRLELAAPLWMLAYGVGGLAAGAFASPIVRVLGFAFLAAGIAQLVLELSPGLALAGTFGGFHLVYGVFALFPSRKK
jgi:hypothetical protein